VPPTGGGEKFIHDEALGTIAAVLLIPQFGAVRSRPPPDRVTPVPVSDTLLGDEEAVLVMVSAPVELTALVGAKTTVNGKL
jgi:hypothetical protein